MATSELGRVLREFRRLMHPCDVLNQSDESLLEAFISRRDEIAFETLVRRHGGMVMAVCRRILRTPADAEDAFQATFFVLARSASAIASKSRLASWLHSVAVNAALKAKEARMKRRHHEIEFAKLSSEAMPTPSENAALLSRLDEEIRRLPEKYRTVIVLSDLQGKSRKETAASIGCPEGTVSGRLARARALLAKRLLRNGTAISSAAIFARNEAIGATSAAVSASMMTSVSQAAIKYAAGVAGPMAAGSRIVALANAVIRGISLGRLKSFVARALMTAAILVSGGFALSRWTVAAPTEDPPVAAEARRPEVRRLPERTDVHGDPLPAGAIARLGTLRFRAKDEVDELKFSPDGKKLFARSPATHAVSSVDNKKIIASTPASVSIWDAESGKMLHELVAPKIGPVAWTADGGGVALIYDKSGAIQVVDFSREIPSASTKLADGPDPNAKNPQLPADHRPRELAISPDGKLLAGVVNGNDAQPDTVVVWDLKLGKSLSALRKIHEWQLAKDACLQILFSPDSTHVAFFNGPPSAMKVNVFNQDVTESIVVSLREVATGKEVDHRTVTMPGVRGGRLVAALAEQGRYLAIGGNDDVCRIYKLGKGGYEVPFGQAKFDRRFSSRWVALAFAGDQVIALDHDLHVLAAATAFEVRPPLQGIESFASITTSPDGKRIAMAGSSGVIRFWDRSSGQEVVSHAGHNGLFWYADVVNDGKCVLTGRRHDHHIFTVRGRSRMRRPDEQPRVWDLATGQLLRQFNLTLTNRWIVAPDKKNLLVQDHENRLRLYDIATGAKSPPQKAIARISGKLQTLGGNDRSVVTIDGSNVHIWNWPEVALRRTVDIRKVAEQPWNSEAFLAPDGKSLVTRSIPGGIDVWDAESGVHRSRLLPISMDWHGLWFEKVRQRGMPFIFDEGDIRGGITFLDSRRLAYIENYPDKNADAQLRSRLTIWDVHAGKLIRGFDAPQSAWTRDVAADPRGYVLATAEDGELEPGFTLIYEVASGQIRRKLPGHFQINTVVAFTPDGNRLVTGGGDSTGLVWDISLSAAAQGRNAASIAELERAWETLAIGNAAAAYDAMVAFASNPDRGVEILSKKLNPVARLNPVVLNQLVSDLASDKFLTRDRATNELEKLSRNAAPFIRSMVEKVESLETKRRLTNFLERHEMKAFSADELRWIRSLEILEQVNTRPARLLIDELATGEPAAEFTIRAIAAKSRLEQSAAKRSPTAQ